jgi:hypothetical protein
LLFVVCLVLFCVRQGRGNGGSVCAFASEKHGASEGANDHSPLPTKPRKPKTKRTSRSHGRSPSALGHIRARSSCLASHSASLGVSSAANPTSASKPGPMAETTSPSTSTDALSTRCCCCCCCFGGVVRWWSFVHGTRWAAGGAAPAAPFAVLSLPSVHRAQHTPVSRSASLTNKSYITLYRSTSCWKKRGTQDRIAPNECAMTRSQLCNLK